jgi:hypothetical protein
MSNDHRLVLGLPSTVRQERPLGDREALPSPLEFAGCTAVFREELARRAGRKVLLPLRLARKRSLRQRSSSKSALKMDQA